MRSPHSISSPLPSSLPSLIFLCHTLLSPPSSLLSFFRPSPNSLFSLFFILSFPFFPSLLPYLATFSHPHALSSSLPSSPPIYLFFHDTFPPPALPSSFPFSLAFARLPPALPSSSSSRSPLLFIRLSPSFVHFPLHSPFPVPFHGPISHFSHPPTPFSPRLSPVLYLCILPPLPLILLLLPPLSFFLPSLPSPPLSLLTRWPLASLRFPPYPLFFFFFSFLLLSPLSFAPLLSSLLPLLFLHPADPFSFLLPLPRSLPCPSSPFNYPSSFPSHRPLLPSSSRARSSSTSSLLSRCRRLPVVARRGGRRKGGGAYSPPTAGGCDTRSSTASDFYLGGGARRGLSSVNSLGRSGQIFPSIHHLGGAASEGFLFFYFFPLPVAGGSCIGPVSLGPGGSFSGGNHFREGRRCFANRMAVPDWRDNEVCVPGEVVAWATLGIWRVSGTAVCQPSGSVARFEISKADAAIKLRR
ncbi:hypothetical protein C7M84_020849 [Penaeus vannamei]|uniref:Uncharacterized protein n=1 Tax=Penaeus vannamei TaxID=6689 RepID=A0A423SB10_PENVA|nr:hypothetical protein C7M84_020849 [Penaeus vannamei]